jgi:hypothetical protein
MAQVAFLPAELYLLLIRVIRNRCPSLSPFLWSSPTRAGPASFSILLLIHLFFRFSFYFLHVYFIFSLFFIFPIFSFKIFLIFLSFYFCMNIFLILNFFYS